jgi:hypothetical protein
MRAPIPRSSSPSGCRDSALSLTRGEVRLGPFARRSRWIGVTIRPDLIGLQDGAARAEAQAARHQERHLSPTRRSGRTQPQDLAGGGGGSNPARPRSISPRSLASRFAARGPPPPSRCAAGPARGRQKFEAVDRLRLLRLLRLLSLFRHGRFGNPRFGTTVGLTCSTGCARRGGGRFEIGQQATAGRRPRWRGNPHRDRSIVALRWGQLGKVNGVPVTHDRRWGRVRVACHRDLTR